eukprot:1798003-Alexandrium_andersonii.AAC.1
MTGDGLKWSAQAVARHAGLGGLYAPTAWPAWSSALVMLVVGTDCGSKPSNRHGRPAELLMARRPRPPSLHSRTVPHVLSVARHSHSTGSLRGQLRDGLISGARPVADLTGYPPIHAMAA